MPALEYNFDGLIGPTHNYAGLSPGNLASQSHQHQPSRPRDAALQGLQKMRTLARLGCQQCVLPPHRRPRTELLRQLGFSGKTDADLIQAAHRTAPELVAACYSAASMWVANAASVSPSADCHDRRLHLSTANLNSTLHRSLEASSTHHVLSSIFSDENHFAVHSPLPSSIELVDEGAANQTRLCSAHGEPSLEIFVYGSSHSSAQPGPKNFPARQSLLASQSIARRHQLDPQRALFWQQNPAAIDAGVFHNDVISVGNQNVLLCHELAFVNQADCLAEAQTKFKDLSTEPLHVIEISSAELSIEDAVSCYLFNSQLVTRPAGQMTMICPIECEEMKSARQCTQRILDEPNPIDEVLFLDLRQSMNNGGGPACLRLRITLTEQEQAAMHPGIVLTENLAFELERWINQYYRETLSPADLADPLLIEESHSALDRLTSILQMPG